MERKNVYIIIFVITTIIASCIAMYFAFTSNDKITTLEEDLELYKSQVLSKENNDTVEEETTTKVETVEKIVEKVVEKNVVPRIDFNKNITNVANRNLGLKYSGKILYPHSYSIDSNGVLTGATGKININEKVVDVCVGMYGQGGEGSVVCITENGNVYTNVSSGIFTKVEGVTNIVKIYNVYATKAGSNSVFCTFITIDKDGNQYDLFS